MNTFLIIITSIIFCNYALSNDAITEITFKSTFHEGFGVYVKKEIFVIRVDPTPGAKDDAIKYYITPDGESVNFVLIEFMDDKVYESFLKKMGNEYKKKFILVGYEDVTSRGVPSLGEGVDLEDTVIPPGPERKPTKIFFLNKIKT